MTKKRQQFSNEFKEKVALEALKGHKTVAEIAREFEIHTTQVNNWKKHLLWFCQLNNSLPRKHTVPLFSGTGNHGPFI